MQRRVKQAEVLEWPHSEVLDKGQGVLERQALNHRRPFQDAGILVADTDGSFFDSPFMPAACGHLTDRLDRRLLTPNDRLE